MLTDCIRMRRPLAVRVAMVMTVAGFLGITTPMLVGCAAEEKTAENPTALRTDYNSLQELVAIMDNAANRLMLAFEKQNFDEARAFATNLHTYAQELRRFKPEQRTPADIAKYDRYAQSLETRADYATTLARLRKEIVGKHEARALQEYVEVIKTYLGPPRRDEGRFYEERLHPTPLDQPDPRAVSGAASATEGLINPN